LASKKPSSCPKNHVDLAPDVGGADVAAGDVYWPVLVPTATERESSALILISICVW
jgi:hypothetical protein